MVASDGLFTCMLILRCFLFSVMARELLFLYLLFGHSPLARELFGNTLGLRLQNIIHNKSEILVDKDCICEYISTTKQAFVHNGLCFISGLHSSAYLVLVVSRNYLDSHGI